MEPNGALETFRLNCQATMAMHAANIQPVWWPNGSLVFSETSDRKRTFIEVCSEGRQRSFLNERKLSEALGIDVSTQRIPFQQMIPLDASRALVQISGAFHELNIVDYSLRRLTDAESAELTHSQIQLIEEVAPSDAKSVELKSPNEQLILTVRDGALAIRHIKSGVTEALPGASAELGHWTIGPTRSVWSDDSALVCAICVDDRGASSTPVTHFLDDRETLGSFKAARLGEPPLSAQVGIINVRNGQNVLVPTEPGTHCMPHSFSPDGSLLFVLETCIFGRFVQLRSIRTSDGRSTTIICERRDDGGMVNSFTDHALIRFTTFSPIVGPAGNLPAKLFVLSDKRVLWISAQSGSRQIYLFDEAGTARTQLTHSELPVANLDAVDEANGWVYFSAASNEARPYDSHIFRVPIEGGEVTRLTQESGVHEPAFSPDLSRLLIRSSDVCRPPSISLYQSDGLKLAHLKEFEVDPVSVVAEQAPEPFDVASSDGKTRHHGVLFKPPGFDPNKKYPVIELIYAGSFVSTIPRTFCSAGHMNHLLPALASAGYVTLRVDTRGTPGRSRDFQDYVCEKGIGQFEIDDHRGALEALGADRPWMDMDRVAITGASYGGFFSIRGLLTHPDFYKAGYAMCPGEMYPSVTQGIMEPYLGPYEDNWDRYEATRNAPLVEGLEAPLRLALGTSDVNTPMRMLMSLSQAFVEADKHVEMCLLPDRDHVFMRPGDAAMPQYIFDDILLFLLRVFPPDAVNARPADEKRGT